VTSPLAVGDFGDFFHAVHGVRPFSWQQDLLGEVAATGAWPELLDLPTASGKTATLDIALFTQALQAELPVAERTAPRRTALVVDRRLIVDQAHRRSQRLQAALDQPSSEVVRVVAERLRALSGGGPAMRAVVLRGGIVRDDDWLLRPDVPALVSTTVDQLGSRLLFRGYGVSPRMAPIHAGLLGTDLLVLLDEVHLSAAFAQTLRAFARYQSWAEVELPARWQVCELSATVGIRRERTFALDRVAARRDVALDRRLAASKQTRIQPVPTVSDPVKARGQLVKAAVAAVQESLGLDHVDVAAVVVNRVATARDVARALHGSAKVLLLTGRMRPLDRDRLLAEHGDEIAAGRTRGDATAKVVLVGTQSVEAGADFDVDALITECASLDALRQRFGRLDRLGELAAGGTPAVAVVLGPSAAVDEDDDPVYGAALAATWRWLSSQEVVDFGADALALPDAAKLEQLLPPQKRAPAVLPSHLDRWCQTAPAPSPDPDISGWLHGLGDEQDRDVCVIWRSDLGELGDADPDTLTDLLGSCPPLSSEALGVPLVAVRRWLRGEEPASVSDVEGATSPAAPRAGSPPSDRPVVRWSTDGASVVDARALRVGDTLVVPTTYGGLRLGTWDPDAAEPVDDLGLQAHLAQRRRAVLRTAAVTGDDALPGPGESESPEERLDRVEAWLGSLRAGDHGEPVHQVVDHLLANGFRLRPLQSEQASEDSPDDVLVLSSDRLVPGSADVDSVAEPDPEVSAFTSRAVPLPDHLQGVRRWAQDLADRSGVPPLLAGDLALAGELHDLGKADPRFQAWLREGDLVAASSEQLLAKSAAASIDARVRRQARKRSGYPAGARHELTSLALVADRSELRAWAHDWDLVRHLVASHHGYCRPFAPDAADSAPVEVQVEHAGLTLRTRSDHGLQRLDAGVPDRFWLLIRRYGWWRLAWLEAVLRLADHRRSQQETLAIAAGGGA